MVPQKERPLTVVGNGRCLLHHVDDRPSILQVQGHEDTRHHREVIGHVTFVAVTEVGPHVGRQLVGLAEQHPARASRIDMRPDQFDDGVRLGKVFAGRAIALDQVRHRVDPEAIDAQIEPEIQDRQHLADDRRVVVVEIRLMLEKPVPVVGVRDRIPRPVRTLGIDEDDPHLLIALVRIAPHVVVALWRSGWRRPGPLEPRMLIGRVVEDQLDDHLQAAVVRGMQERLEIIQHTVTRMHRDVVGDVVAIIFQRRRKKRQQPETGHAQTLEEIQLLAQALEIADTVRVAVVERLDGQLVDDGVFVPERIVARSRSSHVFALWSEAAPVPKRIVFWHTVVSSRRSWIGSTRSHDSGDPVQLPPMGFRAKS